LVSEPGSMATNKEQIEMLEAGLGGVQDGIQRMELGISDEMRQQEETINKLSEALLSSKGESSHGNTNRDGISRTTHEENDKADNSFLLKWPSWNFHDILDKT